MASARERLASAARRLGSPRQQGQIVQLDGQDLLAVFRYSGETASGLGGMVLDGQSQAWLIVQPENLPSGKLAGRQVAADGMLFEVRGKPILTSAQDWRIDLKEIKP